jgi:hypothetical protein
MTTTGIITMIVILAFVWGGFGLFIMKAVGKERSKSQDAA